MQRKARGRGEHPLQGESCSPWLCEQGQTHLACECPAGERFHTSTPWDGRKSHSGLRVSSRRSEGGEPTPPRSWIPRTTSTPCHTARGHRNCLNTSAEPGGPGAAKPLTGVPGTLHLQITSPRRGVPAVYWQKLSLRKKAEDSSRS